jgi:peptidoglycan/LPS O-acetylase OafA/YrhL
VTPPPRSYFAWLDPLRCFAASSVVLYHLLALAALELPRWYPLAWFRIGFLGVDLFFGISGAVILYSLARLRQRDGAGFRRAFALRRAARILPLYLLTCAAFVAIVNPAILQRPDAAQVLLAHAFMLQNLFPSTHGAINGPSWSLGVEMQFYLVVLLLGPWLLRLRLRSLALFGLAIGVSWRTVVWYGMARHVPAEQGHLVFIAATQLPGVFDEFVAGMLALRWTLARRERGIEPRARGAAWLALAALLAWSASIALMHRYAPQFWSHPATVIGLRALLALAVGLTVAAALELPAPRRRQHGLKLSGDLSYGIYLWHMGVLLVLQRLWLQAPPWPFALAVLAGTLLLSLLGWYLLERPVLRAAHARAEPVAAAATRG